MALNTILAKLQGEFWWAPLLDNGVLGVPVRIGNVPSASFNVSSEKLIHYESQTGDENQDETFSYKPTATLEMSLEDYSKKTIAIVAGAKVTELAAGLVTNEAITFRGPGRHDLSRLATSFSLLTNPTGKAFAGKSDVVSYQMTMSTGGGTKLLTATTPHQIKHGFRVNVSGVGNFFAIPANATGIYLTLSQEGNPAAEAEIGGVDGTAYTVTVQQDYTAYPERGYIEMTAGAFGGVPGSGQLLASYNADARTDVRGLKNLNMKGQLILDGVNALDNMKRFKIVFPSAKLSPATARALITSGQFDAFQVVADVYYDASIDGFYKELL